MLNEPAPGSGPVATPPASGGNPPASGVAPPAVGGGGGGGMGIPIQVVYFFNTCRTSIDYNMVIAGYTTGQRCN